MSTIIANIELDHKFWTVVTDPKNGNIRLQCLIEEGEQEWIHVLLQSPGRGKYEGTEYPNSASVIIKNSEREEEVSTRISVGDPRGGFVMESRVNETGHYLSVPTDEDSLPHVDDMEKRGKGFYKLTHYPAKGEKDE